MSKSLRIWPVPSLLWWYASSFDAEAWLGKCESREAALAEIRALYALDEPGENGVVCWLACGAVRQPNFLPGDNAIEMLLQDFLDQNEECWFEEEPVDPSSFPRRNELRRAIGQQLEHLIDPPQQRMIEEFRTMEAIVRRGGHLVVDPSIEP